MIQNTIISVQHIFKSFHSGVGDIPVLKDVSFSVKQGDFTIIFGPSGCGKSTLLHAILGLEFPSKGTVIFLNKNLYESPLEDDRSEFRKKHIGMVYQQANWIKSLTVIENIAFPLLLLGIEKPKALEKAAEMLKTVAMENWAGYLPTELSSGQQQKVALARALITDPEVIIADEPTGNLDFESGQELMSLLIKLNDEKNKTIIMVTHDLGYLKYAKIAVRMFDGGIVGVYGEKDKDKLLREIKAKPDKKLNN